MSEDVRVVKSLEVPLTEGEWAERSTMLSEKIDERERAKLAAKESAGKHGENLKAIDKKILELASAVSKRKERRDIPCEERENARLFRMETVRLDTGEVVDVRPFDEDELASAQQGRLFVDSGDGPADTGTLPNHPPLDTTRGPDTRSPCPGPEGGNGCTGEACTRCAGILFVPTESLPPEPGTEISDPGTLLAAAASSPEEAAKPRKNRREPLGAH
jgi:hypothetical protein